MGFQDDYQPKKKADPIDVDKMALVLEQLKMAMDSSPEDVDQETLVKVIQKNRAFILEYAMSAYLDNPKSASLLEGVTQMLAQMEKTIRDDRKEKAKKKENENNALGFSQLMEALGNISSGNIKLPSFDMKDFILDPSKPLIDEEDKGMEPIKLEELEQGNKLVDLDGEPV